jgi:hypothetical protein
MIDNDIADELEKLIPSSQRSKFVSQAIANELAMHRRSKIVSELLEIRLSMPVVAAEKLISDLSEDRKRG